MASQKENDRLIMDLAENVMDVSAYRKKDPLTDADRKLLLEAAKKSQVIEMPSKRMKEVILQRVGYRDEVSYNPTFTKPEIKAVYNFLIVAGKSNLKDG